MVPLWRDDAQNRLAHHFFRRVAENPLGPPIPTRYNAREVLPYDSIVGGFYNCRQPGPGKIALPVYPHVAENQNHSDQLSGRIADWSRRVVNRNLSAVPAGQDRMIS